MKNKKIYLVKKCFQNLSKDGVDCAFTTQKEAEIYIDMCVKKLKEDKEWSNKWEKRNGKIENIYWIEETNLVN